MFLRRAKFLIPVFIKYGLSFTFLRNGCFIFDADFALNCLRQFFTILLCHPDFQLEAE